MKENNQTRVIMTQALKTAKYFLVPVAICFLLGNSAGQTLHAQEWYRLAQRFIFFDKQIALDGKYNRATFLRDLARRNEAGIKSKKLKPPPEGAITSLLFSSDASEVSLGAVAIFLSKDFNPKYLGKLVGLLGSTKNPDVKRYVILALERTPASNLMHYENSILNCVSRERRAGLIIQEGVLLPKLTPRKSAEVLTELLEQDSIHVQMAAYTDLKELGKSYLSEALDYVAKKRKISKKQFLKEMDKRLSEEMRDLPVVTEDPEFTVQGHMPAKDARIVGFNISATGALHVIYSDGADLEIPKERGRFAIGERTLTQAAFVDVQVAADKQHIGWLASYMICAQSYPCDAELAIYQAGHKAKYIIPLYGVMWKWKFLAGGKQVAVQYGLPHGDETGGYSLYDMESGRELANFPSRNEKTPNWVKELQRTHKQR